MTDDEIEATAREADSADDAEQFELEEKFLLHASPYLYDRIFSTTKEDRLFAVLHVVSADNSSDMTCSAGRLSDRKRRLWNDLDDAEFS